MLLWGGDYIVWLKKDYVFLFPTHHLLRGGIHHFRTIFLLSVYLSVKFLSFCLVNAAGLWTKSVLVFFLDPVRPSSATPCPCPARPPSPSSRSGSWSGLGRYTRVLVGLFVVMFIFSLSFSEDSALNYWKFGTIRKIIPKMRGLYACSPVECFDIHKKVHFFQNLLLKDWVGPELTLEECMGANPLVSKTIR